MGIGGMKQPLIVQTITDWRSAMAVVRILEKEKPEYPFRMYVRRDVWEVLNSTYLEHAQTLSAEEKELLDKYLIYGGGY